MPSRTGALYERKLRALLEAQGYTVIRSAASKTPIDLVAWRDSDIRLIQVKRASNRGILSDAKYHFKKDAAAIVWPQDVPVQMWVYCEAEWQVYDLIDGELVKKEAGQ